MSLDNCEFIISITVMLIEIQVFPDMLMMIGKLDT